MVVGQFLHEQQNQCRQRAKQQGNEEPVQAGPIFALRQPCVYEGKGTPADRILIFQDKSPFQFLLLITLDLRTFITPAFPFANHKQKEAKKEDEQIKSVERIPLGKLYEQSQKKNQKAKV